MNGLPVGAEADVSFAGFRANGFEAAGVFPLGLNTNPFAGAGVLEEGDRAGG